MPTQPLTNVTSSRSRGAGDEVSPRDKVTIQVGEWWKAWGYAPRRGYFKPTALEGKEKLLDRMWDIAENLVGLADIVKEIIIVAEDDGGMPYRVNIKFEG